jgi:hypothetical protein
MQGIRFLHREITVPGARRHHGYEAGALSKRHSGHPKQFLFLTRVDIGCNTALAFLAPGSGLGTPEKKIEAV